MNKYIINVLNLFPKIINLKDTNASNKEVKVYAMPGSSRCMVKLLDKIFRKASRYTVYETLGQNPRHSHEALVHKTKSRI